MFRDEFRFKHFKLWHSFHRDFTDSKWLPLPAFIVYRLIVIAYNLAWFAYNIYSAREKLFIYLTNWTFTILNVYFILATTLSCIALYNDSKKKEEGSKEKPEVEISMGSGDEVNDEADESAREKYALRWEHKSLWLLHILSATGGLWVTAGYWSMLVGNDVIDANNITKHLLNSVFMLIDTCLSCIPVRLVHWLYALLYFVVYIAFSLVYWAAGGTNIEGKPYIYKALNYNDFAPKYGGLLAVFLLVVLPLMHLFLLGLTKLRNHLHEKYIDKSI